MTAADERVVEPEYIVVAGLLVDGHRDVPPRKDRELGIRDGAIVGTGARGELQRQFPAAPVVDYGHWTVLPGLVDCHVHLTMPGDGSSYEVGAGASRRQRHARALRNAQHHLAAGVTTVRDVGSHADLFDWRSTVDPTELPRLLLYGPPLTRPGGHMHLFGGACQGVEAVRARARRNLELGADGLKIVGSGGGTLGTVPARPSFETEELAAAVAVAHDVGTPITAHALPVEAIRRALEAGIDGIEHLAFLEAGSTSRFDMQLAQRLVARAIALGSTLGVNYRYLGLARRDQVSDYELEEQQDRTDYYLAHARRLHELGARLVAASDSGWKYTRFGDFGLELRLLQAAGLSPLDVLHAATAGAAEYLRLHHVGRLAVGWAADLLVVSGYPTLDVAALASVRAVYRAGRLIGAQLPRDP